MPIGTKLFYVNIIMKLNEKNISDADEFVFKDIANNFYVYPSYGSLLEPFKNCLPISIIVSTKCEVFCILSSHEVYEIPFKRYIGETYGMHYFSFENPILCNNILFKNIDVLDFGIMLPKLTGSEEFDGMLVESTYTIVTMEWKHIDSLKNIVLPQMNYCANETITMEPTVDDTDTDDGIDDL